MKMKSLLVASVVLIGCAADASDGAGEEPSRSLTLELEPGHTLEYTLGSAGSFTVGEHGKLDAHAPLMAKHADLHSPSAVFTAYHPDQAMPSEVLEFEAALAAVGENGACARGCGRGEWSWTLYRGCQRCTAESETRDQRSHAL